MSFLLLLDPRADSPTTTLRCSNQAGGAPLGALHTECLITAPVTGKAPRQVLGLMERDAATPTCEFHLLRIIGCCDSRLHWGGGLWSEGDPVTCRGQPLQPQNAPVNNIEIRIHFLSRSL
ncbi:unnamed protein product [Pleuronectes platessa]|uniref:Uncharacterized protein n=1 Tax=Pleuronectes platessa TaxID=8262 RepID=A0A9N7U0J3_PLEPL|nr:unnamed protein product [Pleuronectes platessa]